MLELSSTFCSHLKVNHQLRAPLLGLSGSPKCAGANSTQHVEATARSPRGDTRSWKASANWPEYSRHPVKFEL